MMKKNCPPDPIHVAGTPRGEEASLKSKEPGRGKGPSYRTARDSTGICAKDRQPIIPAMGNIPPA